MDENSSNSMDSEDSFTQLCDPLSEVVVGSVTSTPKSTVTNDFNVEEFKNELIKEINVLKEKVGQLEDKNNYLENEIKNNEKKFFENVENKWKFIHTDFPCCKNKCVNTENPNGLCIKGNGYIQIKSNTNIEYIKSTNEKGKNLEALISSENSFDNPNKDFVLFQKYLNCTIYSLFYYEVKFQFEENVLIEIGLENKDFYIALAPKKDSIIFNDHVIEYYSSIEISPLIFNNNDIIGCGLVYPSNNKVPYVFFTHNGTQIGKSIILKENVAYLKPEIFFRSCSIETNFGNDLNTKPFIYNISNHYPVEEFYRNEEFKEIELN